ncbi:hypothetical protein HID58_042535 [Brassica napus]|uniref:Transposase-associated domain-containing protein n=1 Tax=Brassica napus TaxID=3708 RepID=A0ABQ8BDY0_BRANA|nr:hypothetical protein HID58_042535 [Brassica napus]
MSFYFDSREWMDQRIDHESNSVSEVFLGGIIAFLQFACSQADYEEWQTLLCLCAQCKNVKQRDAKLVSRHLFLYVFKGNYYVWTSHGEKFYTVGESSGANHSTGEKKMWENPTWNAHEDHYQGPSDIRFLYNYPDVPPLFYHEGRISGQCSTGWLNDEDNTALQTFMMINCETFAPYERMFEEYMTLNIPDITPAAMQKAKDTKFADWCKDYINYATQFYTFPMWMMDFVQGPRRSYRSWPIYHTLFTLITTMNSARVPGTTTVPPPMPPGATGPASNHAASSSRSNSYPFGIDPCVNSFILATWQAYYMGPWKSWRKVPDERRESWWQTFVPEFIDLVYGLWKKETWTTIGERISKKKRQHKKPKYINDTDWALLLEHWAIDAAKKKSKKADKSRKSDLVGKGCHKHNAGPRSFARIEYNMMVASGTNERASFTDLVRATHTRPDGTFVDYRAEELVTQAEMEATQLSNTEGSPGSPSASSTPSRLKYDLELLKNVVYNVLCYNAKGKRGHVYGLGSAQYREQAPSSRIPNGLAHNLELEMRDVSEMKRDFASTRDAMNQLLQTLRPQQAPNEQAYAQPQAPTTQP